MKKKSFLVLLISVILFGLNAKAFTPIPLVPLEISEKIVTKQVPLKEVSTTNPTTTSAREFIETFDVPSMNDWQIVNGEWSVGNGELTTKEAFGHQYVFYKKGSFSDFTAQVQVRVNSRYNHPAITFRAKNANNHYICRVNQWVSRPWDGLQLYKKFNPELGEEPVDVGWVLLDSLPWKDIEKGKEEMEWNTWYNLKVQAQGNILRCKMWRVGTEEPEWQVEAVDNTFSSGLIGLEFYTGSHSFDNFKVTGIHETPIIIEPEKPKPEYPPAKCPEIGEECPVCPTCPEIKCPIEKKECPIIKDHTIRARVGQKHLIPGTHIELIIESMENGSVVIRVHDKRVEELKSKPTKKRRILVEVRNYKNVIKPIEITESPEATIIETVKAKAKVVHPIIVTKEELEVMTPKGETEKVKVLPETAVEKAKKKMDDAWEVTLDVVKEKPVYRVHGVKTKKIFGVIPVRKAVDMQINATTSKIEKTVEESKWWDIISTD